MKNLKNIALILCALIGLSAKASEESSNEEESLYQKVVKAGKKTFSKPVTVYNQSGRPVYIALVKTENGSKYKKIKKETVWGKVIGWALESGQSITFDNLLYNTGYDRVLWVADSEDVLNKILNVGQLDTFKTPGTGLVKVGTDQHVVIKPGKTDDTFTFSSSKPRGSFSASDAEMYPRHAKPTATKKK